jgi:hypothetical protein
MFTKRCNYDTFIMVLKCESFIVLTYLYFNFEKCCFVNLMLAEVLFKLIVPLEPVDLAEHVKLRKILAAPDEGRPHRYELNFRNKMES